MTQDAALAKRAQLDVVAAKIDEVANEAALLLLEPEQSFGRELKIARAMSDMRSLLTPEVMTPILSVMNTDLGFRTDRDPKVIDRKTNQPCVPYSPEVVRDCWIEARLRGFRTLGNEFNIIAGRMYPAKNGFRRKLTDGQTFAGLTDFRDSYDVPKTGDKGAIIKCRASWKRYGKPDSFECDLAIRVNEFMGIDGIVGKAERKLCKRVHDLLSGIQSPDADLDDAVDNAKQAQVEVVPEFPKPEPTKPEAKSEPAKASDPVGELMSTVLDAGHTFDDFRSWASVNGHIQDAESIAQFSDVPKDVAVRLVRAKTGMLNQLAARKAGQ